MVRHWILIPAFPGSNPGSAVLVKRHLCVFFCLQERKLRSYKEKTLCENTYAHSLILY